MVNKRVGSGTASLESKLVEHLTFHARGAPGGDLGTIAKHCLAVAAQSLEPGAAVSVEAAEISRSAARWAQEGVALESVLGAYHDGVRAGLEFLTEAAGGNDAGQVVAGAELIVRVLEMVTIATTSAYLDEHRVVAREHQTAAQMLVSALLSGHGVAELARQAGITVASAYQVVALTIPPHPDERRLGMGAPSAARRKLRRVQAALATPLGSRALSLLSSAGGTVLVPIDELSAVTPLALTADVLELVSEAAEVSLTATVISGDTERVPELAARAHALLGRLRDARRAPGLYPIAELIDGDGAGCEVPQSRRRRVVNSSNNHRITRSA